MTARFACRLGTTMPNQIVDIDALTGGAACMSSTGSVSLGISLVDNCVPTLLEWGFRGMLGVLPKWCTAKCGLRDWLLVFSTRAKSTAWVIRWVVRCLFMRCSASHGGVVQEGARPRKRPLCRSFRSARTQTAKRLRPFARRALITARPPRDFIRTRKP